VPRLHPITPRPLGSPTPGGGPDVRPPSGPVPEADVVAVPAEATPARWVRRIPLPTARVRILVLSLLLLLALYDLADQRGYFQPPAILVTPPEKPGHMVT
jgi:hypothetical protein